MIGKDHTNVQKREREKERGSKREKMGRNREVLQPTDCFGCLYADCVGRQGEDVHLLLGSDLVGNICKQMID